MRNFFIFLTLMGGMACSEPTNIVRHVPFIQSITLERSLVFVGETINIQAAVGDQDPDDVLRYKWTATAGSFVNENNNPTQWRAPNQPGACTITLILSDGYYEISKSAVINVINR